MARTPNERTHAQPTGPTPPSSRNNGDDGLGGVLGESGGSSEFEVAVNTSSWRCDGSASRADGRPQAACSADDVGVQERPGVVQGVVVVRLRGVVHHGVRRRHERSTAPASAMSPHHQLHPVSREAGERGLIPRVRELVQHRHSVIGVRHHMVDEVGTDEPGAAGDEKCAISGLFPEFPAGTIRTRT